MSDIPIPPDSVLPCGCVTRCRDEDGVRVLTYIPCHQTCVNYLDAIELAGEIGLSVERKVGP